MTEPDQADNGWVKKWAPIAAAIGVVGGGGTFAGNLLGNRGIEEVKASVAEVQKHCDEGRGGLVKILDVKFAEIVKDIDAVVKDQKDAYKAFGDVTSTLKLTVERLADLRKLVERLAGPRRPK